PRRRVATRRGLAAGRGAGGLSVQPTTRRRFYHGTTTGCARRLMSTAARAGARAQMAVPAASASADKVIDAVKPSDADDDQVDRHHVVQQPRHEEDQDAGDKGNKWGDMGNGNGHWDLLVPLDRPFPKRWMRGSSPSMPR